MTKCENKIKKRTIVNHIFSAGFLIDLFKTATVAYNKFKQRTELAGVENILSNERQTTKFKFVDLDFNFV